MATFLDISSLSFFSSVFTFLLVFVAVYAMLTWGKILGSNQGIHALMASAVSVLFMFSKDAVEVITYVVPWFVMLFIGILFILMAYSLFMPGIPLMGLIMKSGKHKTIVYWILALSIVIILLGLGNTFGNRVGPYLDEGNDTNRISGIGDGLRGDNYDVDSGDYSTNLGATIFHPRMLGMVFILLLATFTILFLAREG